MNQEHVIKIKRIAAEVARFYTATIPFKIYHGSTNSTRILSFKKKEMLDTSGLDKVLNIDIERSVAIVEPNVPMGTLVNATLKYGLIPPVVPEFPGITVGGIFKAARVRVVLSSGAS